MCAIRKVNMHPFRAFILILLCMIVLDCHGLRIDTSNGTLSKGDALHLAVELANAECMRQYSIAPFDSTSYVIEFREQRWYWGRVDVAGINGYSAKVSFDKKGRDRRIEIFFSTDVLR